MFELGKGVFIAGAILAFVLTYPLSALLARNASGTISGYEAKLAEKLLRRWGKRWALLSAALMGLGGLVMLLA